MSNLSEGKGMKSYEAILRKAYSVALTCLLVLLTGFLMTGYWAGTVEEVHFPGWLELVFKSIFFVSISVFFIWPVLYLIPMWKGVSHRAFRIAAVFQLTGYLLVALFIVQIYLFTCGDQDYASWQCNADGKSIVVTGIGIPFILSLCALVAATVYRKLRRRP